MDTVRVTAAAAPSPARSLGDLRSRAQAAAAVAAAHALSVDRDARFPKEAFAAIREQGLLGLLVPKALGGEEASLAEVVDVCFTLGQACGSSGMIFAMHQIKMGCLVRHHRGSGAIERILRAVASEQWLLASSTTEGNAGGNVRSSEAALERESGRIRLERKASVISYALAADGIVTTARRAADAAPTDQVLVVFLKSDYALERLQGWDTLGMRGTVSEGFTLRATGSEDQVLGDAYEKIHAHTMVPFAHLCWGGVWSGIATAATARAQAFIRHALRQSQGQLPPAAPHLTQALASLRTLRSVLTSALTQFERAKGDERALSSLEFQSMITLTKVEASELAVRTVTSAMRSTGLAGYRNDGEFSIGRHLRDVLSAPIMINNDRILANLATSSILTPLPPSISG
jgi:acyl-CoA dehydrogenase